MLSTFTFSEIRKIQTSARDHFQKIFNDHEKLKLQLESHKRELDLRGRELEKREAHNENERKKLCEEIEKVLIHSSLKLICLEFHHILATLYDFLKGKTS